jgi:hypothetical protein
MVATLVGVIATPSYATAVNLTLSQARGQNGGGNSITATGATGAAFTTGAVVQFSYQACASTFATAASLAGSGTTLSAGVATATTVVTSATVLTVTVPTGSSGLTLPSGMTAASLFVCSYASNSGGALTGQTTTAAYSILLNTLSLSTTMGPSGGGNTVVATPDTGAIATGNGVEFQYGACTPTYSAAVAIAATNATTQTAGIVPATSVTVSGGNATITVPSGLALLASAGQTAANYTVCVYGGTTAGTSTLSFWTTPGTYQIGTALTLTPGNGPSGGGNTITATATGVTFLPGTVVEFQVQGTGTSSNCSISYTSPTTGIVAATDVRVLSGKLAIAVPSSISTPNAYEVCAYASTTTTLLAGTATAYTVAAAASIAGVSPTSGASMGGTVITVSGTFPSTITSATIGGVALTITRSSSTSFTASTPAHAPGGPFTLAVTTSSGTAVFPSAFTYTNGITATPRNAPNTGNVDVDVAGIGFIGITFSSTNTNGAHPTSTDGHVFLVQGAYDSAADPNSTFKTVGPTTECVDVLVVSDAELVCTMWLAGNGVRRTVPTVTDLVLTSGSAIATSSAAPFTAADVGLTITGTGIPNGTIISAVTDPGTIVLSNQASTTSTSAGITVVLANPRTITDGAIALGTSTTTVTGTFAASDRYRTISGPGIPPGTTITAVAGGNGSVTISQPATASGTSLTIAIGATPIPIGTYTLTIVNDGSIDAIVNNSNFLPSVISSGSTFTVAPY